MRFFYVQFRLSILADNLSFRFLQFFVIIIKTKKRLFFEYKQSFRVKDIPRLPHCEFAVSRLNRYHLTNLETSKSVVIQRMRPQTKPYIDISNCLVISKNSSWMTNSVALLKSQTEKQKRLSGKTKGLSFPSCKSLTWRYSKRKRHCGACLNVDFDETTCNIF